MLDSLKIKTLRCERGSSLVEYAILLAFIAVVAIGLSPEWDQDFDASINNEFKPNNIATGVRWILFKIYGLLGYAGNTDSYN